MSKLEEIQEQLKKAGYDVGKTACRMQLTYAEVHDVLHHRMKPPEGLGRSDLAPYLVTTKRSDASWSDGRAVREARIRYNAGTHDMVQHAKDGWVWLYSVPLKNPVPPRRYFNV